MVVIAVVVVDDDGAVVNVDADALVIVVDVSVVVSDVVSLQLMMLML